MTDAEDILYLRCIAEGAWESGFHTEFLPEKTNVRLIDCVSRNNGQKGPSAWYGAGYMVSKGMILENCTSEHNTNGYFTYDGGSEIAGSSDLGSGKGIVIHGISDPRGLKVTDSTFADSACPVYVWSGATRNVVLDNITIDAGEQPRETPGIEITPAVRNPDEILIRDSVIRGHSTGIHNAASGQASVDRVTVLDAETDLVNCRLINPA
ncbi:hypothetical protein ASZ90_010841 [hydrocarbon metagenome]|uniref:Right handed beta helix domain-containing protein n=1 Tax=hydrocarbon metagenome TaxID=938273 RepID=A0A0W8FEX1_9ZZZZ